MCCRWSTGAPSRPSSSHRAWCKWRWINTPWKSSTVGENAAVQVILSLFLSFHKLTNNNKKKILQLQLNLPQNPQDSNSCTFNRLGFRTWDRGENLLVGSPTPHVTKGNVTFLHYFLFQKRTFPSGPWCRCWWADCTSLNARTRWGPGSCRRSAPQEPAPPDRTSAPGTWKQKC